MNPTISKRLELMTNTTIQVDYSVIYSPEAQGYFARADRRVTIGLRAALELLGIPVPDYAVRRKPGRTPARDVLAAFSADYPKPPMTRIAPRKPNYSPPLIALAPEGNGAGIFASLFPA